MKMIGWNFSQRSPRPNDGSGRRGPAGSRPPARGLRGQRLALIGVAGESVGVLAGAAGWHLSGELAWLIMAGISLALALVLLRRV